MRSIRLSRNCQQKHSLSIAEDSSVFSKKNVKLLWQIKCCGDFRGYALKRGDDCECRNEREKENFTRECVYTRQRLETLGSDRDGKKGSE